MHARFDHLHSCSSQNKVLPPGANSLPPFLFLSTTPHSSLLLLLLLALLPHTVRHAQQSCESVEGVQARGAPADVPAGAS